VRFGDDVSILDSDEEVEDIIAGMDRSTYFPRTVPLNAIRTYARKIVELFHPTKIVLFGSYAYGKPTSDSDVDLLVVMPTRNQIEQAVRIDEAIEDRGFPLDLLVRTPKELAKRLRYGDSIMQEIVTRGKVLYENHHSAMGTQGRKRRRRRATTPQGKTRAL
jgi:predicted nucleotidyltransferase